MEIKPCPFCGGKAEVYESNHGHFFIRCKTGPNNGNTDNNNLPCPGNNGWCNYKTKEQAIAIWNTRVSPWIRIEDELPKEGLEVDIFLDSGIRRPDCLFTKNNFYYRERNYVYNKKQVIAWMPIPEFKGE